jgi:hypothetical protein
MSKYSGRVLAAHNRFAEFKKRAERMWMMLEEIGHMVDDGQAEGLQAKCTAVMPFWVEYNSFQKVEDEEGEAERRSDPLALQIQLLLDSGIAGVGPIEIRRRLDALENSFHTTGE